MKIFDPTLIYLIFDVESIGDGPRVPRAHLEVVFATSHHNKNPPLYLAWQLVSVGRHVVLELQ